MKFRLLMISALLAAGCGTPSFLITPVQRTEKLEETQVQPGNSAKIALIPIDGLIANAKSPACWNPATTSSPS